MFSASPDHVSLKNMCFQNNMCAEAPLGEFAISLVLVILCKPVKVESESRNFSEEQHVLVFTNFFQGVWRPNANFYRNL